MSGTIVTPSLTDFFEEDIKSSESISQDLLFKFAQLMQALKMNNVEALGSLEINMLSESRFQSLKSNAWVLCDGRNITSTDYGQYLISEGLDSGTVYLPDLRGMHLVGNNGSRNDGNQHHKNPSLGGFVSGDIKSHWHYTVRDQSVVSDNLTNSNYIAKSGIVASENPPSDNYSLHGSTSSPNIARSSTTGQSQNTVNAIGVNYFIKVWNVPQ